MKYWEKVDPGMRGTDPIGDAVTLAGSALLAKALMIKGVAAGGNALLEGGKNLLKNEVSKMTVSNAAFKKGLLPQLTRGGIKNWQHLRPWNSFLPKTPVTPGGTLQTLPTPAAAVGTAGAAGTAGLLIKNKNKK